LIHFGYSTQSEVIAVLLLRCVTAKYNRMFTWAVESIFADHTDQTWIKQACILTFS